MRAVVYSAAPVVHLYQNGTLVGTAAAGKENRFTAIFKISYQPGVLEAVSVFDGKEISRSRLETTGDPAAIRVRGERASVAADGHSLIYVTAELVDEDGRVVADQDRLLTASVSGAADLTAFGSANPITEENYTEGRFTSWRGRVQAILRAGEEAGEAVLTISADGLDSVSLRVLVQEK